MCDDETSVTESERVAHRKGLQATVEFPLKVRGDTNLMCTLKTAKYRCIEYCSSTPYAQPGTRVFGAEEDTFLEGALVANPPPNLQGKFDGCL